MPETSVGELETELARAEAQLKNNEEKLRSIKGNRTAGAAALLIGILLVLFGGIVGAALGVFLGIIGVLTLFTAAAKQTGAQNEINTLNDRIAKLRGQLADMRVQPVPNTSAPTSAEERLSKLSDLKAKGLIDDTEYQAQRQKILSEV